MSSVYLDILKVKFMKRANVILDVIFEMQYTLNGTEYQTHQSHHAPKMDDQ